MMGQYLEDARGKNGNGPGERAREGGGIHLVNCIANQGKGWRWGDEGLTATARSPDVWVAVRG